MLIDMVQSRSQDLQTQAGSLRGTIDIASKKYEGMAGVPGVANVSVGKRAVSFTS